MSKKYYAIRVGKETGVFNSWDDCKDYVVGFSGAEYKSFKNKKDAIAFVGGNADSESKNIEEIKEYKTKHEEALLVSNEKDTVAIYTDGSWAEVSDGKIYAGGFLVIENSNIVAREICNGANKGLAELRNVAGEMQAVIESINYVMKNMPHIKHLYIYADYNGVVHWTEPLGKGGWKRNNMYTQNYRELIDKAKAKVDITLIHVKGHNDDIFNEEADALASYSRDLAVEGGSFNIDVFFEEYSYLGRGAIVNEEVSSVKKEITALDTIQKREKLNYVYPVGEKGNGGAYHAYRIHKADTNKYEDYIAMIDFQNGARSEDNSHHGVIDTDLLEIVRHRLQCFQAGEYATEDNQEALEHIEKALIALNKRVEDRIERGVLGKEAK